MLNPQILFLHFTTGEIQNLLRQAEPLGDRKGIASSRYADEQAISRAERVHIKLHAGIDNAFALIGVGLEFTVVRTRHHPAAKGMNMLQYGDG
ncbi:hypothetical protein D3C77_316650 [compost metagenome]